MANISVRDVPEQGAEALRRRAARCGAHPRRAGLPLSQQLFVAEPPSHNLVLPPLVVDCSTLAGLP